MTILEESPKLNMKLKGTALAVLMASGMLNHVYAQEMLDSTVLEEIVVTASKRSQTLLNTPIAVSVVSGRDLEEAAIRDVFDLQSLVPSLEVQQSVSTIASGFSIRGFGGIGSNAGIEPSVGVFVDGIYRSRSSAQISDLINIERVEVLRGPQSTLFGKNASVGVVSIHTKQPEFERTGSVSLTVGNENEKRIALDVTGPLTDSVAYRLSTSANKRDGYATNLLNGEELNDRNRFGLNGQLLYQPNDSLSIRVIADYDEIDEACCFTANLVNGPITGQVVSRLGGVVAEDPFSYKGFVNTSPINEVENAGISLQIEKDLGFADLTSITSFRTVDSFTVSDSDATGADLATFSNTGESETFIQEIRFTSNSDSNIGWMIGGSFFDEEIDFPGTFQFGTDFRRFADGISGGAYSGAELALGLPLGSTFGQAGQGAIESTGQDNQSWSIFTSVDFLLSDALTATIGLSYIEDEKDAYFNQENTDAFSSLDFVAVGFSSALAGLGVNPIDPSSVSAFAASNPEVYRALQLGAQNPQTNPLLALGALQFLPPVLGFPNEIENGNSFDDELTYNLRIAYDIRDSLNVYASFSTGFKATSFNLSRNSRPSTEDFIPGSAVTNPPASPIRSAGIAIPNLTNGTRFAGPEESEVIEVGVKYKGDRLGVNLALFEQTVEGFQSNVFTGLGFALANAGKQSTKGVEIDGRWLLSNALTLSFSGSFYDPVFDEFANAPSGNLTGQRPAGVSRTSTSIGLNYKISLLGKPTSIRADWQHSGKTNYFDDQALQNLIGFQREYDLVNAAINISLTDHTSLAIWGRNIFDEQYITSAFSSIAQDGSISGYANQPSSFGLTFKHTF